MNDKGITTLVVLLYSSIATIVVMVAFLYAKDKFGLDLGSVALTIIIWKLMFNGFNEASKVNDNDS